MELEEVLSQENPYLGREEKFVIYREIQRLVGLEDKSIDKEICEHAARVYTRLKAHIDIEGSNMTVAVEAMSFSDKLKVKYEKYDFFNEHIPKL